MRGLEKGERLFVVALAVMSAVFMQLVISDKKVFPDPRQGKVSVEYKY